MSTGPSNYDFDGGSSSITPSINLSGGSVNPVFTPGTCTFEVRYSNVAKNRSQLAVINWTFKYGNDPYKLRFFKSSFNVHKQAQVVDSLDLASFFHPLLSFSSYQKQTFVIAPENSITIDTGSFDESDNQMSFVFAKAEYLLNVNPEEKILFWDYGGNQRYPMGEIMALSGAIKQYYPWKGWNISPFENYGHTGPIANPAIGGITFTNPTGNSVRLTILTSN